MDDDLINIANYTKTRLPAFKNVTFEEIVKEFISDRQREKLSKMLNFKVMKHHKYNLSSDRLKKIENFLQFIVKELLSIKK